MEKIRGYQRRLCVVSENVGVIALRGGNALALCDVFERAEQVAIGGGLFVQLFVSSRSHALFETVHQIVAATFEKHARIAGGFGIALVGGEAGDARAEAALDVILQAGARMATRQVHVARRHHEALVNEVENAAGKTCWEIRPEIERAVLLNLS